MEFILTISVVILFILFFRMKGKQDKFFEQYYKKNLLDFKNKLGVENSQNSDEEKFINVGEKSFSVGEQRFDAVEQVSNNIKLNNDSDFVSLNEASDNNHEYNIGSKIIPAIGIISVLFGVGFFLKYTFDHNLIDETGRVILGFIFGIGFIGLGDYLRKKYSAYSAMLMGGGFAIFYIAAKFGLTYELYSNTVAFILMSVVTLSTVLIAYKTDSRTVAIVALLGGFLNPVLVSTGQANEAVLFNYILLLLAGMIFLAWKRGYLELIIGSAVGTMILYGASFVEYYTNSMFTIYWAYLIVFFAIFTVTPFLLYFSKKSEHGIFNYGNLILPVVVGGVFMSVSYFMFERMVGGEWLNNNTTNGLGINTKEEGVELFKNLYFVIGLIPTVLYLALSKISLQKFSITGDKVPVYFFVSMATFAIAMIPALQFSGAWVTFAWFLEALVLAFITFRTKIKLFLNVALPVLGIAIFRLFSFDSGVEEFRYSEELGELAAVFTPILNERTLLYTIGMLVVFSMAYVSVTSGWKTLAKVLGVVGNIIALLWISMELSSAASVGYISHDISSLVLSMLYMTYASVLMWIGIAKNYSGFRIFSIVLFAFVIAKAYLFDIWELGELLRIFAFIILGLVTLTVGYYYAKNSEKIKFFLKG